MCVYIYVCAYTEPNTLHWWLPHKTVLSVSSPQQLRPVFFAIAKKRNRPVRKYLSILWHTGTPAKRETMINTQADFPRKLQICAASLNKSFTFYQSFTCSEFVVLFVFNRNYLLTNNAIFFKQLSVLQLSVLQVEK